MPQGRGVDPVAGRVDGRWAGNPLRSLTPRKTTGSQYHEIPGLGMLKAHLDGLATHAVERPKVAAQDKSTGSHDRFQPNGLPTLLMRHSDIPVQLHSKTLQSHHRGHMIFSAVRQENDHAFVVVWPFTVIEN